jgi:hypothetical protein
MNPRIMLARAARAAVGLEPVDSAWPQVEQHRSTAVTGENGRNNLFILPGIRVNHIMLKVSEDRPGVVLGRHERRASCKPKLREI